MVVVVSSVLSADVATAAAAPTSKAAAEVMISVVKLRGVVAVAGVPGPPLVKTADVVRVSARGGLPPASRLPVISTLPVSLPARREFDGIVISWPYRSATR